jgi:large repetitive protein
LSRIVKTASTGLYVFPLIPSGAYLLWAKAPGFETYYKLLVIRPGESLTIDISLVPDYSVQSIHKTGAIVGTVLDSLDRSSIWYASVTVVNANRARQVDTDGRFAIYELRPGPYVLQISASGHKTFSIDSVLVYPGKATTVTVYLPRDPYTPW